jgi:hypothetical protein
MDSMNKEIIMAGRVLTPEGVIEECSQGSTRISKQLFAASVIVFHR